MDWWRRGAWGNGSGGPVAKREGEKVWVILNSRIHSGQLSSAHGPPLFSHSTYSFPYINIFTQRTTQRLAQTLQQFKLQGLRDIWGTQFSSPAPNLLDSGQIPNYASITPIHNGGEGLDNCRNKLGREGYLPKPCGFRSCLLVKD